MYRGFVLAAAVQGSSPTCGPMLQVIPSISPYFPYTAIKQWFAGPFLNVTKLEVTVNHEKILTFVPTS